jgi:hypothetical protein
MDDLMDLLVGAESSPTEVSDKIKEILYAKSSSKIDAIRPDIGASLFGEDELEDETDEVEVESEEDEEEETQTGDEDVD